MRSRIDHQPAATRLAAVVLIAILFLALFLRLDSVGFGLPSMYDRDEPLFVMNAIRLLKDATLNPRWFGHPATTTFYGLALVDLSIIAVGFVAGWWHDSSEFAAAIYADPGIIFLANRLFIVACGVVSVWLTYLIGRRLADARTGAIAALLLAVCPLHVEYSQIIRTDVQASAFMLAAIVFTLAMIDNGHRRDRLLAAMMVGLACATKWPAVLIGVAPFAACFMLPGLSRSAQARCALSVVVVAMATLFITSPFLLLDYRTVMANLTNEARPEHLGATGGDVWFNLNWYVHGPLARAFGAAGLVFAALGMVFAIARYRRALPTIVLGSAIFFVLIATRSLVWPRWAVPLLPFIALFVAIAIREIASGAQRLVPTWAGSLILALAVALPMTATTRADAVERANDTRGLAVNWIRAHVPRDRSIVLEALLFELLHGGWRFRYPVGALGCVDVAATLAGRIDFPTVERAQKGRTQINLGTIDPAKVDSCHADYAIVSELDRFAAEAPKWIAERGIYAALLRGATPLVTFRPVPGRIGGPVVRIYRLPARTGP